MNEEKGFRIKVEKANEFIDSVNLQVPILTVLTGLNGAGKTQLLRAIYKENNNQRGKTIFLGPFLSLENQNSWFTPSLSQDANNLWQQYQKYREAGFDQNFFGTDISSEMIVNKVLLDSGKQKSDLDKQDFELYYPVYRKENGEAAIFSLYLGSIFKRYHEKLEKNNYRRYKLEVLQKAETRFLSDEDFLKINGERPWIIVNQLLVDAGLPYHFNGPEGLEFEESFQLELRSNQENRPIEMEKLSTGEKVTLSIALSLFNSTFGYEVPRLILLDEIDSSLHPSMIKYMLQTIEEVLVKKKGIQVILTTHSPTTIALSPEDSIFVLQRNGKRIGKSTKEDALKILLEGVPSVNVLYEHQRQVFVESSIDAFLYTWIYENLKDRLNSEVSLNFISSGESKIDQTGKRIATCDQVRSITQQLRKNGNRFIHGIVDWDCKNFPGDHVEVLGTRYSIENYIFDPLILGAFLLREQLIGKEKCSLQKNENYYDLKNLDSDRLQKVSNGVLSELGFMDREGEQHLSYQTIGNRKLSIPKSFVEYQGHELEKRILEKYSQLKQYRNALKKQVVKTIFMEETELVPHEILELMIRLQS